MTRIRESGMPEEEFWESLLNVPAILDSFGIDANVRDAVEVGCGYGTFSLPVARRISGTLYAMDIDPAMLERTKARCVAAGVSNVVLKLRDVAAEGFGPVNKADVCLLFNILHCENPVKILRDAAGSVGSDGQVLVIHWRYESSTPRGPSLDIRPRPEQIIAWARETGVLKLEGTPFDLPPWHYGLKFRGA